MGAAAWRAHVVLLVSPFSLLIPARDRPGSQGMVMPPRMMCGSAPAKAYVLAVYDEQKRLQYVGFSQDLRNSLRTLLGRRPDKAHYYK